MAGNRKIEIYVPPSLTNSQVRGLTLKLCRIAVGLTLEEMAKKIHRSDDTIRRWEKGTVCPDLDDVTAIAEVLGQPKGFLD